LHVCTTKKKPNKKPPKASILPGFQETSFHFKLSALTNASVSLPYYYPTANEAKTTKEKKNTHTHKQLETQGGGHKRMDKQKQQ